MVERARFGMVFVVSLLSCGPGNRLSGRVTEILDLNFESVRAVLQPGGLRIEYITLNGSRVSKTCRLAVDGRVLQADQTILGGDDFLDFVTLNRSVELGEAFPRVIDGIFEVEGLDLTAPSDITGGFAVEFEDGRSLLGEFATRTLLLDGE